MRCHLYWQPAYVPSPGVLAQISSLCGLISGSSFSVSAQWFAEVPGEGGAPVLGYNVSVNGGTAVYVAAPGASYTFTGLALPSNGDTFTVQLDAVLQGGGGGTRDVETLTWTDNPLPVVSVSLKEPNPDGPGVSYTLAFFTPVTCAAAWNYYEIQYRLYYNGFGIVPEGDEDGWELLYAAAAPPYVTTQFIGTAVGVYTYQFRARASYRSGATVVSQTNWGPPVTQ